MPVDAAPPIDAPLTPCPLASGVSFEILELGRVGEPGAIRSIALAGDGTSVVLSVMRGSSFELYRIDAATGTATSILARSDRFVAQPSVDDGIVRVTSLGASTIWTDTLLPSGVAEPPSLAMPSHASRFALPWRPVWDGAHVVVADETGFFGPVAPDASGDAWRQLTGAASAEGVAERPTHGATAFFTRVYDAASNVVSFERRVFGTDGTESAPPRTLDVPEPWGHAELGWTADPDAPLVVAELVGPSDAATLEVHRFDEQGTARGSFTAPVASYSGTVDLSDDAIAPRTAGYAVIAAVEDALWLHGGAPDFVSDARRIQTANTCWDASIAAGRCGYVVGCLDMLGVELFLAVPPAP